MPGDDHDSLCLTTQNTHKQKCKIFDTGASKNAEQDRSMCIVHFELKVPIPMKQGEGVLCATGMGIVIYNFCRDDRSVYSEPGFALHTPKANAGMSIISKALFQDVSFWIYGPSFRKLTRLSRLRQTTGSLARGSRTSFLWCLSRHLTTDEMRFIRMYSNNNSNLSLVPVYSEEDIVDNDFKRYSFTTGELYDERAQISVLLEKLVTDDGRSAKYHPNVVLALFANHCMLDVFESQPDQASGSIWHHSKERMEQHLAGSDADNHTCRRSRSRRAIKNIISIINTPHHMK